MSIRYYEFGPFQIEKLNHALLRNRRHDSLKPKVFDTLLRLVENRERILDKDESRNSAIDCLHKVVGRFSICEDLPLWLV